MTMESTPDTVEQLSLEAWSARVTEHFQADRADFIRKLTAFLEGPASANALPSMTQAVALHKEGRDPEEIAHVAMSRLVGVLFDKLIPPEIKLLLMALSQGAVQPIMVPNGASDEEVGQMLIDRARDGNVSTEHQKAADGNPLRGGILFGGSGDKKLLS